MVALSVLLACTGVKSHYALMPITPTQPKQLVSEKILCVRVCMCACLLRGEISCCSVGFVITSSECIILL